MIRKPFNILHTYRSSIVFLTLSLLSGGLNYLYYPLISRMLSVEEFGSSQALITLLTQAGSLFAGLSLLSIFLVKKYGKDKATNIINQTQKIIISTLLILTAFIACFHAQISQLLNMTDSLSITIVAIDLAISIPFIVTFGVMLAEQRFLSAAYMQLIVVSSKLALGAILVPLFGSAGAIVAIGISYLVGMGIYWLIAKTMGQKPWSHNILRAYIPPTLKELRQFRPFVFPIACILIAATVLVVLPGIDVLVARHYLDSTTAGIYSAASTISSVVLFASLPVINILVPLMNGESISKSLPQLKKALILLGLVAITSLAAFFLAPALLLSILGDAYTQYSDILVIFGVNMVFICVLTLIVQILVLYRPLFAAILSVVTLALVILLIMLNHNSGRDIITAATTSYGIMVTVSTIVVIYYVGRRKRATWLLKK